ncbi:MAG: extracellular solute-binding protein [Chloroflexaceae bacterium]|nr:extracellular solute-binding protein [Chloroflexaceae bacterium]
MASGSDRDQLHMLARAATAYHQRRLSRRSFLRLCASVGVGFSSASMLASCGQRTPSAPTSNDLAATAGPTSASEPASDAAQFLQEAGQPFAGSTIRIVTELTPPSQVIIGLIDEEFSRLTDIQVEWQALPLEQVLALASQDFADEAGNHDIYYFDQAWLGRFVEHTLDPRELTETKPDLVYPNYNLDDFIESLLRYVASYQDRLVGLPYDIPIQMLMYRKDLFEELGLTVPTTLDDYLETVRAIHDAAIPELSATAAMWRSGHYALQIDASQWIWAHGGAHYGADEQAIINSEESLAALEYMRTLAEYMPPEVTSWDWSNLANAMAQKQVGMALIANEFLPSFDNPEQSQVVGLIDVAQPPMETALRPSEDCGYDEKPGMARQGGSCLALSRYSRQIDPAWLFMQWATSSDVQTRASILGGGATPLRRSTFNDPRVTEKKVVGPGTTRHFDVVLATIETRMGSEPHLPAWAALVEQNAIELGKFTTGSQDSETTLANLEQILNEGVRSQV